MKLPKSWLQKDGLYSWIVLLAITVNGFCGLGWLFGSIGVLADVFPGYLGINATKTNALVGPTSVVEGKSQALGGRRNSEKRKRGAFGGSATR